VKLRYTPGGEGEWLLVVARTTAVLYRATTAELADPLLAALEGGEPVQAVLDLLTQRGLASTPAFALASWSGATGVVLLARGPIVLTAETSNGTVRLDGKTVTTWHETRAENASAVNLGDQGPATSALTIEAGVVWASGAWVGEPPVAEPASVAEPARPEEVARRPSRRVEASKAATQIASTSSASGGAASTSSATVVPENTITELSELRTAVDPTESDSDGYGHLFEETVVRSIEDAAVRPIEPSDDEPDEDAALDEEPAGDHDGMTVMSGDLAALRASRPASKSDSAPRVPVGHTIYLELSTGGREPVGPDPILVGRSPSVRKVSSGAVPRLVTIPGDQDISRNHARFELEGDTVVVTDLHSRNGTSIVLPGKSPQILRQGEPTPVIIGTVVDLGGGVTLTVREDE
jgi:hypothetical protein